MGGEGHMLDMIRRLKEGRDSSRLRRERTNERMKRLQKKEPYPARYIPGRDGTHYPSIRREKRGGRPLFRIRNPHHHRNPSPMCRYTMGHLHSLTANLMNPSFCN